MREGTYLPLRPPTKIGQTWDLTHTTLSSSPPHSKDGTREGHSNGEEEGPKRECLLSRWPARASWAGWVCIQA